MTNITAEPESLVSNTALTTSAAMHGILGALIGALPISILKTLALFRGLCFPLSREAFDTTISLWSCGVLYNTWAADGLSSGLFLLSTLIGAALFGILAAKAALRWPRITGNIEPPRVFWWSFGAGILFDLIFVFIFMYPGQ